ncbi:unnamed protein product [Zymoseptoria tritici ST99CH_1A5]|uniref:Endosomal/vacuolar adapter protein YPT35 n=1 Tax=Zymoseptoria tritici ST99CH_1A5 TaxID=1276529 RepID=A0A1Y6LHI6_ZYMTR|nr:unnamed protein product [Zymoseptoria tritici ST99CH_1A5]
MSSRHHHKEDHAIDDDDTSEADVRSSSPSAVVTTLHTDSTQLKNTEDHSTTSLGLNTQDANPSLPAMSASAPTEPAESPQQQPPSPPSNPIHHQNPTSTIPPFWSPSPHHTRSPSSHSFPSTPHPSAILLIDHTSSPSTSQKWQSCWAQSVSISSYILISGPTGIGAYVVWHVTVQTLEGGEVELRKRYSECDRLWRELRRAFPHAAKMIPKLPRKSVVSRFRPEFLEGRRMGLEHFLTCILLNPEFASSPILKEFVFS